MEQLSSKRKIMKKEKRKEDEICTEKWNIKVRFGRVVFTFPRVPPTMNGYGNWLKVYLL